MLRSSLGVFFFAALIGCSGADFAVGTPGVGLEADTEAGADTGLDTGLDTGDTGADTGHETGADTGLDTGIGADTGVDTGVDTGTDTSVDTGTDTSVDTGTSCSPPSVDGDGDGEGPGACGDCHDGNALVHSRQESFINAAYTTTTGGSSFDYNCDGVETKQFQKPYVCTPSGSGCLITLGLEEGASVPACGALMKLVTACKLVSGACQPSAWDTFRRQGCH